MSLEQLLKIELDELHALLARKHSKRDVRRLQIRHFNQEKRLIFRESKIGARKK
jgi:hypothetical protein